MFRRRLGNYLIKRMWELQNQPADLATYTRNRRRQGQLEQAKETSPPPATIRRKEESPPPVTIRHQEEPQPMTYQIVSELQNQGVIERSERVLNPDELLPLTQEMVLRDISPPRARGKSWISPLLAKNEATLQDSFAALDYHREQALTREQVRDMFRETLAVCEMEPTPHYLETFSKLVDQRCSDRMKTSFGAFVSLVEEWAEMNPLRTADFATQLRRTIQEYEEMIESLGGPSTATRSIETLVDTLKSQLRGYLSKKDSQKQGKSLEEIQSRAIADLFSFYARQIRLIGTTPTFDEITTNNSQWTVGKFFKFCSDKDLMGRQTATARRLNKEEIMAIFKKTAALTRNMELSHFVQALDEIAGMYFDGKYDEMMAAQCEDPSSYIPVCDLPLPEKRKKLYKLLKLGDSLDQKPPSTNRKPSLEARFRPPPEDDSLRRPRFRLPRDTKAKLDEVRAQKQTRSVDPRASPPKPQIKPIENLMMQARAAQPSYSQKYVQKNVSVEPLNWQSLNKMHPSELASEEDMRNVIGDEDEEDEEFGGNRVSRDLREKVKKMGPQAVAKEETRMDQAMRQIDKKMESGYKALKRNSTKVS